MMDLGFQERGALDEVVGLSEGNLTRVKQKLGLQLCFDDMFVGSSQPFYKGLGLRVRVRLITYSLTRTVTIPLDGLFPYTNHILLLFGCFRTLIFMGFSRIWTRGTNAKGPNRRTHVNK
jgi:hypothetical protein